MNEPQAQIQDNEVPEEGETLFGLTPDVVREVAYALDADRTDVAVQIVERLHAADVADLIEQLPGDLRQPLMEQLAPETTGDMLAEVEESTRDELLRNMEPEQVAEAVSTLDSDDAVYVLEDMSPRRQQRVLAELGEADAASLADSLSYEDETAGRMMQRDLVAVPGYWTVGQVIDFLRDETDLPEDFYQLFVIDTAFHPLGGVHLSKLLRTHRPVKIADIMEEEPILISVHTDREEIGQAFTRYDLVTAPVVDDNGRLVGCITFDDVVEAVEEEVEEDALRLAGVGDEAVSDSILSTARSRFSWLLVNLGTAILASLVIGMFADTLEQVVALAILMPIVASMGGNAGTQTLTIAVRALATRDLTAANAARIVGKEVVVGGLNGIVFAILMGLIAVFWFNDPMLGGVIAMAMVINMLVAGLSGIVVPMGLDAMKIDPALASSVFVTTVTDIIGFFAFLGLAAVFLL